MKNTSDKPAFTQGEWKLENEVIVVSKENPETILATVNYLKNKQGEANAKLISASPEMYEALKELLQASQQPDLQRLSDAQFNAQKALAKAEGK